MRHIAFLLSSLALACACGCARTSDGSVEVPEPYLHQSFVPGVKVLSWRRPQLEPPPGMAAFPAPPSEAPAEIAAAAPRAARPARRSLPRPQTGQADEGPRAEIVCRDVTNTQRRVRVVCD